MPTHVLISCHGLKFSNTAFSDDNNSSNLSPIKKNLLKERLFLDKHSKTEPEAVRSKLRVNKTEQKSQNKRQK